MYHFTDIPEEQTFQSFLDTKSVEYEDATFEVRNYSKIYPERVRTFVMKKTFRKKKDGFEERLRSTKNAPQTVSNAYTIDDSGRIVNTMTGEYKTPYSKEDIIERSVRRTKTVVSDIILCNEFKWFGTFTFNCRSCPKILQCKNYLKNNRENCICPPQLCKRFDDEHIKTIMQNWLKNQKKIHGNFNYLIIPERHKSGALHFHGLIGDNYKGSLVHSGKYWKQRKIYNVSSFRGGYTNFTEIENKAKTGNYVTKYVTKDMPLISGKKRYWCTRSLVRPQLTYNMDILDNPFIEHKEKYNNDLFTAYDSSVTIKPQQYNNKGY